RPVRTGVAVLHRQGQALLPALPAAAPGGAGAGAVLVPLPQRRRERGRAAAAGPGAAAAQRGVLPPPRSRARAGPSPGRDPALAPAHAERAALLARGQPDRAAHRPQPVPVLVPAGPGPRGLPRPEPPGREWLTRRARRRRWSPPRRGWKIGR